MKKSMDYSPIFNLNKEGKSVSEIARLLNISTSTVSQVLINNGFRSRNREIKNLFFNAKEVQSYIDSGNYSKKDLMLKFNLTVKFLNDRISNNEIVIKYKFNFSEETKKEISNKRIEYLRNNKNKHVWKRDDKFKSVPCEKVKEFFKSKGLVFVEEYNPIEERAFSIDIAFPDKKIGIEINGNQHYEANGELKPYYKERSRLIETQGWKLIELHYHIAFNIEKLELLFNDLIDNNGLGSQDLSLYHKKEKVLKQRVSKIRVHKHEIPKEELENLLWLIPTTEIAKKYNISDTAISKKCKKYNLNKPPRGYWTKLKSMHL